MHVLRFLCGFQEKKMQNKEFSQPYKKQKELSPVS